MSVDSSTRMFVDYWRAESGQRASKRDWVAAWRNWLRKDATSARGGARPSPTDRALATIALGQESQRAVSA